MNKNFLLLNWPNLLNTYKDVDVNSLKILDSRPDVIAEEWKASCSLILLKQ